MFKALELLRSEIRLLDALLHRNKSQHGRAAYYKHLQRMCRDIRLLEMDKLGQMCQHMLEMIQSVKKMVNFELAHLAKQNRSLIRAVEQMGGIIGSGVKCTHLLVCEIGRYFFLNLMVVLVSAVSRVTLLVRHIAQFAGMLCHTANQALSVTQQVPQHRIKRAEESLEAMSEAPDDHATVSGVKGKLSALQQAVVVEAGDIGLPVGGKMEDIQLRPAIAANRRLQFTANKPALLAEQFSDSEGEEAGPIEVTQAPPLHLAMTSSRSSNRMHASTMEICKPRDLTAPSVAALNDKMEEPIQPKRGTMLFAQKAALGSRSELSVNSEMAEQRSATMVRPKRATGKGKRRPDDIDLIFRRHPKQTSKN